MDEPNFSELIPEIQLWNEGRGIDAESWVHGEGNYELAVGYSLLFWPRLIEFEGYVLRASRFEESNLRDWERATGGDKRAIEAVINHEHLLDIHGNNGSEATEVQLRYLGRILKETIGAKLKIDYPNRQFEVAFNDEPNLALPDYEITFWQVRDQDAT